MKRPTLEPTFVTVMLLLVHSIFWFGVASTVVFSAPHSQFRYGDHIKISDLIRSIDQIRFGDVFAHAPPVLSVLLVATSMLTIVALAAPRIGLVARAVLLGTGAISIAIPGLFGMMTLIVLSFTLLMQGTVDGEMLSEQWLPRAAMGIWFATLIMGSLLYAIRIARRPNLLP